MSHVNKVLKKVLQEKKSLGNFFLNALGEIALVVIGILIAIQIDNWNEERKTREEEKIILMEIRSNLELDLNRIERNLSNLQQNLNSINIIRNFLDGKLSYHDSLDIHFARIIRYGHFPPNTSGYELLKSKGLETISSTKLRREISLLYERYYNYIKTIEEERYRYNYSTVIEQLQTKFHNNEVFKRATPNDINKLRSDQEFREVINITYSINEYIYQHDYSETKNLVKNLIQLIDSTLKKD